MTVPALALLAELRSGGLRLTPDGDQHLRVAPAEKLTPTLRQRILAAKPDLIAVLRMEGELERRIRAMAERWQYTADDLAYALVDARRRPDAWLMCCAADEVHHDLCERAGVRFVGRRLA